MYAGRKEIGRRHQQERLPTQQELAKAGHHHSKSSHRPLCAREVLRKCMIQLAERQDGVRLKFYVRVQALQRSTRDKK